MSIISFPLTPRRVDPDTGGKWSSFGDDGVGQTVRSRCISPGTSGTTHTKKVNQCCRYLEHVLSARSPTYRKSTPDILLPLPGPAPHLLKIRDFRQGPSSSVAEQLPNHGPDLFGHQR